jgi:hypothetical protein
MLAIDYKPQSEPHKYRSSRPVERLGYGPSLQPARQRAGSKSKQAEPENPLDRVNGGK